MEKLGKWFVFAGLTVAAGLFSCSSEVGSGGSGVRSVEVYDYKPHYRCSDAGQDNAIDWIEGILESQEADVSPDFFALSQLEKKSVTLPENFGSLGGFCDHAGSERHADVIGILYDASTWTLDASFPIDQSGNACPLPDDTIPPATCTWGESTPCCACTGDPQSIPDSDGRPIGDRAFTIGRFHDESAHELCVVVANLPHPVAPDGQRGCDLNTPIDCVLNSEGTGFFGTENFVNQLSSLCGDIERVIFLGDTNASNPDWSLAQMFPVGVMSQMNESDSEHYTCCFDDAPDPTEDTPLVNRYPTDRIGVRGARSIVTTGGSDSSGVAMESPTVYEPSTCPLPNVPENHGFPCCGSHEEHAPLRSRIDF